MKAVIFDMDGLMFDTERILMQAWDYAGEKIGIGKAGFMAIKTLGMNLSRSKQVWDEEFGDAYDLEALTKATLEYYNMFYAEHKIPVKNGLYILLEYLKNAGITMAVASSSPKEMVYQNLNRAGVKDYFSVIVHADMVNKSKPEPDIYLKASELLGVPASECYALEDAKSGLLSAYHAGCQVIMVPDLWQADEETEAILTAKCKDLEEVKEFIFSKQPKEMLGKMLL